MPPEPRPVRSPAGALRLAGALALGALGSACAVTPPTTAPATAPAPAPASAPLPGGDVPSPRPAPAATPTASDTPTPVAAAPVPAAGASGPSATSSGPDADANARLLRYAERVRALNPAELAQEITALGDPGPQPAPQLQLAMALMQTAVPVDTARALGLAQRVIANGAPEAAPYRPLARLLAARLLEQRRLEEALDRQGQQLREQQRRIEQLTERLEAMRAIERSLNNRAPATAPRPPTP